MTRPLHVLLSRLCFTSVTPSLSASGCRSASKGVPRTWTEPGRPSDGFDFRSGRMSDGPDELEDVEDKLQTFMDDNRRRQKTVKYHMIRRKMTPPGAPQRKLTWEAMEQIRYLKQEQPEEWTVDRLAESFSVTPDVVRRVLRSKFVPLPERREKQNAKALAAAGVRALPSGARQDRLALPGNLHGAAASLPSGRTDGALPAVASQTRLVGGGGSASLPQSVVHVAASPAQRTAEDALMTTSTDDTAEARWEEEEEEEEEDEDSWDGQVLTEQELEELMETEKPSPVMQMGKDFFDAEGNFLYRI